MSKPDTTPAPDPEDEFYGGIWWVRVAPDSGLRSASPGECATEIKRLRDELAAANSRCIRLETELCK